MDATRSGARMPRLEARTVSGCPGGGERIRTADFYVANVALCQLSYTPEGSGQCNRRSGRDRRAGTRDPAQNGVSGSIARGGALGRRWR